MNENLFAHALPIAGELSSRQPEYEPEHVVDYINGHRWIGKNLQFQVAWKEDDVSWESLACIQDCVALDVYLQHHKLKHAIGLSKKRYYIDENLGKS